MQFKDKALSFSAGISEDIETIHFLTTEPRQDYQIKRINESLKYLGLNSPFYRDLFAQKGVDIEKTMGLDEFRAIPFTEKEDLQLRNMDFLCVPKNKIIDHCSTSGTLGEPVHILLTENDLQRLTQNEYLGFSLAGIMASDCVQVTTTMDKRFMAGLAYFLGIRKIGAGIIRNGSGLPAMQWDTILSLKPNVILAVPSFLVKLIDYAKENNIDLKNTSVKKAICIGESIRNTDGSHNNLGSRIIENWPIHLYSTYASTEMQTCFTECKSSKGGHLLTNLIYAEIVDEDGNVIENGSPGELVITTFGVEGMPLLRYKTGDICSMNSEPCECGRTSPRLSQITGRKKHMLKIKGTTLFPSSVFNILDKFNFMDSYVLEVKNDPTFGDDLSIFVHLKAGDEKKQLEMLEEKLNSALRIKIKVEHISKKEIELKQWKEGDRKPNKFVDHRLMDSK